MKEKKLFLPTMILLGAVLVLFVFVIIDGISKKPVTTEAECPFSITYELDGKTETIQDVYACSYIGTGVYGFRKERNYTGSIQSKTEGEETNSYILYKDNVGELVLETGFEAAYLMGDYSHNYYIGDVNYQPYLYYIDDDGNNYEEGLEISKHNAKIIDWEYPEPIENRLKFSHISGLSGESVIPITIIGLLTILASMFLVKKEPDLVYTIKDRVSIVCNFFIALIVIPFSACVSFFSDIVYISNDLFRHIVYFIPAAMALCVAASICLRRKGYSKSGFIIPFFCVGLFMILVLI